MNAPTCCLAIVLSGSIFYPANAQDPCGEGKKPLQKVTTNDNYSWFTINKIFNWYGNNGNSSYNLTSSNQGLEYPAGSGKCAVLEDGIVWGGFHKGRATPKVGGSTYRYGLQAGVIRTPGGPGESDLPIADDPTLAKYRVYRVRPDVTPGTSFDAVKEKMQGEVDLIGRYSATNANEVFQRYIQDWNEWPAKDGLPAPFKDVDGNGTYDPTKDIPGVPGAAQTLYYVANDLDSARTKNLYTSPPIGLEMHRTVWGYSLEGPLASTVFSSTVLINKSGAVLDSAFLVQWSDPDLGESGDDYAGCDVVRSLGFVYNGKLVDYVYGAAVPAAGYDLLQGPRIATGNLSDSSIFMGSYRRGYRTLPMTSFGITLCGSGVYTCPSLGSWGSDRQWYLLMNGRNIYGAEYLNPFTQTPTKFLVDGDPLTGEGWIDGWDGVHPGDRYLYLISGPFRLASGDTQEVVVALSVGQGADRISSVSVLKHQSDVAQAYFDNLLEIPVPPPSPAVISSALDGEVVLTWSEGAQATESWKSGNHAFEGYNVYQFDGPQGSGGRSKRVATFDIPNNITWIFDDVYDPESGVYLSKPVQRGSDSGIKHFWRTTTDSIHSRPIANGSRYYFGVSSYSFSRNAGGAPKQLESTPVIHEVIPQWPQGLRYTNVVGDTLKQISHDGPSTGLVVPIVCDPTALPRGGATYRVIFRGAGAALVWDLTRTSGSTIDTVARSQSDQTGSDETSLIVDGILWRVYTAPRDFRYLLTVQNAAGPITPFQQGAFSINSSGFPTTDGKNPDGANDRPDGTKQQSPGKLSASKGWGIHTGMNSPTMSTSYSYFKSRVTNADARWPVIIPYDWEIRFTAAGGKALIPAAFTGKQDYIIDVPFELWNVGINTPDNTADDYRLFPYVMDVDNSRSFNLLTKAGTDTVDLGGGGSTHSISGGANDPLTDWFYWTKPVNTTPGETGYNAILAGAQAAIDAGQDPYLGVGTNSDVLRRMVLVGWNIGAVATGPGSYTMTMPEVGTVFRIVTTKPNGAGDIFTVSIPAAEQSPEIMRADADRVNVFPNPFIGSVDPNGTAREQSVTFTHLPPRAILRIFSLAGTLVRSVDKNDTSPIWTWDLKNDYGGAIAPGMYIVYVDMPEVGVTKTLKLGILTPQ
jgi:hypothetical protein